MSLVDPAAELALESFIAGYLSTHGWLRSENSKGYDRKRALFPEDVFAWLEETQPAELAKVVKVGSSSEQKDRDRLLDRLVQQLDAPMTSGGGSLNVIRQGFKHVNAKFKMCQFKPATTLNTKTVADYRAVRLRVMQQVTYSAKPENKNRLDLVFFVNGVPVATAELKSQFKQDAEAAKKQYREDRDPAGEPLLGFGTRAIVHFAMDDDTAWMTTKLGGGRTVFLPFNKGTADGGKGNPPNPAGHATAYVWEEVLQRDAWLGILGSTAFLQTDESEDPTTGKKNKTTKLMFPRYHQWDAVRRLIQAVREEGAGLRYLIQHSAGSGKTNTIGWLAYQLARLHRDDNEKIFDKVIIVSDRRVLDRQLQDAIRQIESGTNAQVTVIDERAARAAEGSKRKALIDALKGKSLIVVVTLQSFPMASSIIADELAEGRFAVIADEAHSSQSGSAAVNLRKALAAGDIEVEIAEGHEISQEDVLNAQLERLAKLRAEAPNISYFAFTATPKNKTLSLFGRRDPADSEALPHPFHLYSMRQAIEEGFILDVLRGYQSYKTAFKIEQAAGAQSKTVDSKTALRKIMRMVKLHPTNIGQKVEIIVEHFRANVAGLLDSHAKAMVVTESRVAAVKYKREIDAYISKNGYDFRTIVAFSGKVNDPQEGVVDETEHSMNPGLGADLAKEFRRPEYRVMLVADKFQTGFDQPLLCAMYVDKKLEEVYAVQTLSRLNRTYVSASGEVKDSTFVLDFVNDPLDIQSAFEPYYLEARVTDETDPNAVHALAAKLVLSGIYDLDEVNAFAMAWFGGGGNAALSAAIKPAKDRFAEAYQDAKDAGDDSRLEELTMFRKDAASFVRLYDFMSQVIDYGDTDLEKLSVYLRHLVRVIEIERLRSDIDISDVLLKTVTQIDKGKAALSLTGTGTVGGGMSPGGGLVRPVEKPLAEVIQQINAMFAGELPPDVIEGFVNPVVRKALESKGIKGQISTNALDQFLNSQTLREALVDASLSTETDVNRLIELITGEGEITDRLIEVLGRYMYEQEQSTPE
ncbi:DEAD/DEAH box helicase family protein [Microbacterium sp. Marseille-Q6648]|uniref:type I restriction endonuclease subunit R n=1 Tax=Microbacterium sp. Marseille-Q6648 TaxID=2937991 RepID=UPI00203D4097|nr:DEAD/DEAH box helicase family protein [Microbacterium sp. Marseille-Q6648]